MKISLEPAHDEECLDSARSVTRWPTLADVLVLCGLGACAVLLAVFWWSSGKPTAVTAEVTQDSHPLTIDKAAGPAQSRPSTSDSPVAGISAAQSESQSAAANGDPLLRDQLLTVDLRGQVRKRGIQELPSGSRVIDAIVAAGGLRSGAHYGDINLAAPLQDGQQVRVGGPLAQTGSASSQSSVGDQTKDAPVSLNSATASNLEELPGVGPVLAQRIIAWRDERGRFDTIPQLLGVAGIGEKVLAGMADQLSLQ
jgi:competence protein ComEA